MWESLFTNRYFKKKIIGVILENGIDAKTCANVNIIESVQNLFQHAINVDSVIDVYLRKEEIILVSSSTGKNYSDILQHAQNYALNNDCLEDPKQHVGTVMMMWCSKQMGFIHNYSSPNPNFNKIQTAFYLVSI